jgi:zinc transporter ZupT
MTYLILFLSVAVGALAVRFLQAENRVRIRLLTAFGGAYVFSVTILHLLPEATEKAGPSIGYFILAGFFLQVMLEYFSRGIEHGHAHHHDGQGAVPVGIIAGLCVHAFLEGVPLGGVGWGLPSEHSRRMLLASIVMHNVPVSLVLVSMLLHNGMARGKVLGLAALFAAMSPAGALLGEFVPRLLAAREQLTAVVIGIFLHLSTTILFETSEAHRFNRQKIVAIVLGTGAAIGSAWIH